MPVTVVIGSQWGDEGKGKLVDLLSAEVDIVARYQGGANAGHTICIGDETHVLHLVPSGIFHDGVQCVIGNGVVIDPVAVMDEIRMIRQLGIRVEGRLFISHNAHLIMPYHKRIEQVRERARDAGAIGTTGRGIGPAYVDKFARTGIRVVDLLDRDVLRRKLTTAIQEKNAILREVYKEEELDVEAIIEEYVEFDQLIDPFVTDTTQLLGDGLAAGKHVLAEGAQGSLLDVDHGTYPFVTSSHPTAGGACTGLGIPPTEVNRVIAIVKAYTTRVGNGPFPTELEDATGELLRKNGHEFGATTGRPRRCGWLDLVALNYTSRINGFTELAITKLDVLSGIDALKVATRYRQGDGKVNTRFPSHLEGLQNASPEYQELPGWQEDITEVASYDDLPDTARSYLQFVSENLNVPISYVSTGPKRSQTIAIDGVTA
ncbi:MAG: adenylosuccinate synthase [Rhodothermales bacterium]|nr:adenylosuccinate synthase [Rhodothermales bacterium]MBO6781281.1 adenylosuccinate synthase [Rhodothermales bacterium]